MDSYDKNRERFERTQGSKIDPHGIKNSGPRVCKNCGRKLLPGMKGDLCPKCAEQELFCDVRDYIRANDVKDYDVAEHFGIPLGQVKAWIKQGRIQYKDDPTMKQVIMGNYCQICGTPTSFGTICPKCMREQKKSKQIGVAIKAPAPEGSNKMRFMEDDK